MEDRISGRQAGAWGFCALSVPAVLTCAKLGWGWVLLGCGAAAAFFYLTQCLAGETGAVRLTELTLQAFGRTVGRVLLGAGGVFALLAAAQTAARAGAAFPDETAQLAGPAILALAALANQKSAAAAARVCGVVTLILAVLYTITMLSAARQVQAQWLRPWGSARQMAEAIPAVLSVSCLRYLPQRRGAVRGGWLALLICGPAALAAVTAGCLSPRLTQVLAQPFYTVSQSLSILDVMERFEPLVSAALLMGFFALESLLLASAQAQILAGAGRDRTSAWESFALAAAAFGLSFLTGQVPAEVWAIGAAVCWGILPLLTQLIVAIK